MLSSYRIPRNFLRPAVLVRVAFIGSSILSIARAGQLDMTLGNAGLFETNEGPFMAAADATAFQSDGKIVAAGNFGNPETFANNVAVARYLSQ